MNTQDAKSTFGYLVLLGTVIAFILSFASANYFLSILLIVGGILLWMIYINVANVQIHRQTGAILIIFGILLSSAIFMAFGIEQDIWGGYRVKPEGAILSLVILFFAVMPGLILYYFSRNRLAHRPRFAPQPPAPTPAEPTPTQPPEEYAPYPDWEDYEYYYGPEMAAYDEGEEYEEEDEKEESS